MIPPESESSSSDLLAPPSPPLPIPLQTISNALFLFFIFCIGFQSLPQSSANCATQFSPSPFSPLVPHLPPLSSVAPPRTCREPSLPGHGEPEAPPWSEIALSQLQTCGLSAALWSATPFGCGLLHPTLGSTSILVTPTSPQTSGSPPLSREVVAVAPSWPPRSSPSLHDLGSSAGRWAPSSPSLPPVIPMVNLISVPPWLLPPSMPS